MKRTVKPNAYLPPRERREMKIFLGSHVEWEHISLDAVERFGTDCLHHLDDEALDWLAMHYGYYDDGN